MGLCSQEGFEGGDTRTGPGSWLSRSATTKTALGVGDGTQSPRPEADPNMQVGTTPTLVPWLLGENYGSGKVEDKFFRLVKLM